MVFRDNQAIYLQIAEYIGDKILAGKWKAEDKIPSIRELAVELEVNHNTVQRTYEFLQNKDIIYTKRGMGFYVSTKALAHVMTYRKELFFQENIPVVFRDMALLGITIEEIEEKYNQWKSAHLKN